LNIQKYEPPIPACLAGVIRGNFPSFIPKTDQERIQNLKKEFESYKDYTWEVTEKLDGSSCTMYYNNGEFGVCSRNLDLKYDENNTFWKMAIAYDVEEKLKNLGKNIAIQGEVIGEGIQGNPYVIKGQKFFVFDVYDIDNAEYLDSRTREEVVAILDLKHVPVFGMLNKIPEDFTIHTLLELAEGKSSLNPNTEREGLVYKCYQDPSISFKCISNLFLIKNGG
jgi:RNA ligase (TIGR02306 family)